jgi:hypothetical protein
MALHLLRWAKRAALFAWELPQNTLGALELARHALTREIVDLRFERERVMVQTRKTGVSLGLFVFWTSNGNRWHDLDERNRDHEWGHSVQSRWLGPAYLPVVGATSVSRVLYMVAYREITGRKWTGYYSGFPENWADRLGGVRR